MKHRKHPRSFRRTALQLVLSLALVLMVGGYFALTNLSGCTYTITDGDQVTQITTNSVGTDHVLQEAGIALNEGDKVSVTGGSAQKTITISRGQNITVNNAGKSTSTVSYGGTIGDLLSDLSITLSSGDTVTVDGNPVSTLDSTYDGMTLDISRSTSTTETTTESVPYETVSYLDPTIPVGETQVQTPGVEGSREVTTELIYQNGELVSSDVVSSRLVSAPVNEVVLIGARQTFTEGDTGEAEQEPEETATPAPSPTQTAQATKTSAEKKSTDDPAPSPTPAATTASSSTAEEKLEPTPTPEPEPETTPEPKEETTVSSGNTITTSDGQVLTYTSTISVEATAYTGGGTTATGTSARYGAIAVDPSVIPYGTKMYIVSDDGKWIYGVATAEDCGGAIKGHIVDLYFDDYSTCIQFGRRNCTVYILDD